MTSNDAIPDREELRRSGDRRTRRATVVLTTVMAALLALVPVVLVLVDRGAHPVSSLVVIGLVPAVVFLAVVLPARWWLRRRRPQWQTAPLSAGAERDTRRAVRQAIRTGHAVDVRVDALAREQAEKTVGKTVALKIYAGVVVLQLGLLLARIVHGGRQDALPFEVVGVSLWLTALVIMTVNLLRSRRYLRDHPHQQRSP